VFDSDPSFSPFLSQDTVILASAVDDGDFSGWPSSYLLQLGYDNSTTKNGISIDFNQKKNVSTETVTVLASCRLLSSESGTVAELLAPKFLLWKIEVRYSEADDG